jgi:hypothetical protein
MVTSNSTQELSYEEYLQLVINCSEKGMTTGPEQSQERIAATTLNATRMVRIFKQIKINEELDSFVGKLTRVNWHWLVISEAWCGDSAQNLPIIAKIAELIPNIKLSVVLRDENEELMKNYLTDGTKSIPKLICIDSITGKVVGVWGPRPTDISLKVKEYKANFPDVSHDEFVKNLHLWYAKDKGQSMQKDLMTVITNWTKSN